MQNAPYNYNSIYEEGDFDTHFKVNIDGTDYAEDVIWSMRTSRALLTANTPLIGNALVGQIDLTITKPNVTFSRMARIRPYLRLFSRQRRIYSGWLQKGEFFIDTREEDKSDGIETLAIQGFDAMRKTNQSYPSSTLRWSANSPTALQVVQEIARYIGVQIEPSTVSMLSADPQIIGFPAQYTMAETLGSIAAMYASNFCISDIGKLMLSGLMDLPECTNLLVDERGRYITFGGYRIKLRA